MLQIKADGKEEITEDRRAYLDVGILEGQKPALKRNMRELAVTNKCSPKIVLKIIGGLRMMLNYKNSSNLGNDFAYLWKQLLHRYLNISKVKIYFRDFSKLETLLIVFRTGYKRVSLFIKSRVVYATGEISKLNLYYYINSIKDDRGFIVPKIGKKPKNFIGFFYKPNKVIHN